VKVPVLGVGLSVFLLLAGRAPADPIDPPPESPEGADYAAELTDTLTRGDVEIGLGASGRAGGAPRRRRLLRFAEEDVSGTVRDGPGDPLAGGSVEGRNGTGSLVLGRLAPRWGRGLVIGAPADPWQAAATDRGARAAFRGRAGEGLLMRRGEDASIEALIGRFSSRDLAGMRVAHGRAGLAVLGDRQRRLQSSLAFVGPTGESELALDARGRWRAEGLLERSWGRWTLTGRARGGHDGFRSLAEPQRNGAAQALAATGAGSTAGVRVIAIGSCWRFGPGRPGARLALALERSVPSGASLALGWEEQHGVRRDAPVRFDTFRQGMWGEWRSRAAPLVLGLRQEMWGERGGVRGQVRVVSTARLEARAPAGIVLRVTHTAYRVRRGERLYLAESESDRLVLRALSGDGARSRIEVRVPVARGHVSAALLVSSGAVTPAEWTLDWTRRSRRRASSRRRALPPRRTPPDDRRHRRCLAEPYVDTHPIPARWSARTLEEAWHGTAIAATNQRSTTGI